MATRLYVGNIPYTTDAHDLETFFGDKYKLDKIRFITDRDTGRPRGFAFVEVDDTLANDAVAELNGKELGGRRIVINVAREREERGGGGGGRGREHRPRGGKGGGARHGNHRNHDSRGDFER